MMNDEGMIASVITPKTDSLSRSKSTTSQAASFEEPYDTEKKACYCKERATKMGSTSLQCLDEDHGEGEDRELQ